MSGISERTLHHADNRFVKVCIVVDDDGILATHLGQNVLDTGLGSVDRRCLFIDRQANLSRSSKGDHVNVRTSHQQRTNFFTDSGQEVDDTIRQACGKDHFHEFRADDRGLFSRLDDHGIPRHQCRGRHTRQDCQREIPRGDHGDNAARTVEVAVFFSGKIEMLRVIELHHLLGVVHAEIDRFADVRIGFGPRLAAFEDLPGGEFKSTFAHFASDQLQILGTVLNFGFRPLWKRPSGGFDRGFDIIGVG